MKKIIFFDTETTGNTKTDFLCQLAYKIDSESFNAMYKPPLKIPPEASAVHHITNKMVENKKSFKDSPDFEKIKILFENENSIMVAHNAIFDLSIMRNEGIEIKNFICTLRTARYLDSEEKIDKYNLQYLRYFLEIEIDATAHDALGDVLVLEQLYERLKKKVMEQYELNDMEAIQKMIKISSHPSLFKKFKFGKHNGKSIEEVARTDKGYLEWLLAQKLDGDEIDEDWIYTLKHYLGK
ncbi:MAG: exonuclease domain-containing protein [Patescibacteria group bacterium]